MPGQSAGLYNLPRPHPTVPYCEQPTLTRRPPPPFSSLLFIASSLRKSAPAPPPVLPPFTPPADGLRSFFSGRIFSTHSPHPRSPNELRHRRDNKAPMQEPLPSPWLVVPLIPFKAEPVKAKKWDGGIATRRPSATGNTLIVRGEYSPEPDRLQIHGRPGLDVILAIDPRGELQAFLLLTVTYEDALRLGVQSRHI